jgi:hypothetical protein
MKVRFITGFVALLMAGTIVAAAPGREENRERIRVFYLAMGLFRSVPTSCQVLNNGPYSSCP